MNMIVSMMAAGAKKHFSREEYRKIREEANTLFQKLTEENQVLPKAMRKHTGTNIFPAIAVYKTLLSHGMDLLNYLLCFKWILFLSLLVFFQLQGILLFIEKR